MTLSWWPCHKIVSVTFTFYFFYMSFSDQINSVSKSCHFISDTSVEFVISFCFLQIHLSPANSTCVIHCNIFTNKSQQTLTHSKLIGTRHHKHFKISTHPTNTWKLHWLPIKQRIDYKLCFLTYKTLKINNLHIFTIVFHLRHTLHVSTRSSDSLILSIPYVRSSLGQNKRSFSVIGPRLWNSTTKESCSWVEFINFLWRGYITCVFVIRLADDTLVLTVSSIYNQETDRPNSKPLDAKTVGRSVSRLLRTIVRVLSHDWIENHVSVIEDAHHPPSVAAMHALGGRFRTKSKASFGGGSHAASSGHRSVVQDPSAAAAAAAAATSSDAQPIDVSSSSTDAGSSSFKVFLKIDNTVCLSRCFTSARSAARFILASLRFGWNAGFFITSVAGYKIKLLSSLIFRNPSILIHPRDTARLAHSRQSDMHGVSTIKVDPIWSIVAACQTRINIISEQPWSSKHHASHTTNDSEDELYIFLCSVQLHAWSVMVVI